MKDFAYTVLMTLTDLGYLGIALGLMIEVIPSEIVLAYGGYLISLGKITFLGALIAGTIGGVIAQLFLYWAGYYGGRPFLEKYGKYILIRKKQIDLSEQWFNRYGPGVIFTARFIPVVRHAISIPAGIVKMPAWKFTLYTTLAVIPWSLFFLFLGHQLGSNWQQINEIAQPYVRPVIVAAILVLAVFILYSFMKRPKR
ncbi:DedA family protein [Effusibacillus dendaii]|uniref:Membrane protein n=1 Tax=Effusibacillus dendaii TaxID=2743772 RepID=A0A7I8D6W5_9BACL|nr:DedA family protein [Effusibacillus dendaii]BCJ85888.1 membrane protein [Effusibacillus dendaii]